MTSRERMRRALTGELPDRIPLCEISIWPETVERWRSEGMPADADPLVWLGMDPIGTSWFDGSLTLPEETLEEHEDRSLVRNTDGVTEWRWKSKTATPHKVEYLINTPDDWVTYRERLQFSPGRIPANYGELVSQYNAAGHWFAMVPSEPIWWALMAMGFERALEMMMDHPDVVAEMVEYQTRLNLDLIDAACEIAKPDALWHFADLCYRNGMLFSPKLFREMVLPSLRRITDACWERGIVPMYHCCGNVTDFVPLLIEAGYACAQPLESRAGSDVCALKAMYGDQITLFGNMSVERLSGSLEEVEAEVRPKVACAAKGGRYIFHSDHSIPPTVPLENYRLALDIAREEGSYE